MKKFYFLRKYGPEKVAGSRMIWEGLALVVKSVERGITEKGSFPSEAAQHI